MGKHGDPDRHDTNPLRGIFRKTEPAHGFPLGQDPEPDNTGDGDRWEDPRDTFGGETDHDPDAVEHFDPITDTGTETTIFEYGRSPAYPEFQPDPEPFPSEPDDVEPPPDVNQADYEIARNRSPRVWPWVLVASVFVCAVIGMYAAGRSAGSSEPVSDRYSAVQATVSVTVTATTGPKKSGAQPRPAVTVWRTRTPEPRVIVSRVPVPGPTVVTTRTAKPKPAPTVTKTVTKTRTVTEQCTITITVRRDGTVISEESSGDC